MKTSVATHLQRQTAVKNQCLQSHLIFVEFEARLHSESGKEFSSKCDSVRESSEIHHSSAEVLSHHKIIMRLMFTLIFVHLGKDKKGGKTLGLELRYSEQRN